MSGGIFKKQKMPSGHRENRWSEGRESWGLEAPDTPELRPVLLHLVGEGALGPTEGLGNPLTLQKWQKPSFIRMSYLSAFLRKAVKQSSLFTLRIPKVQSTKGKLVRSAS